jgi:hypothetical protein
MELCQSKIISQTTTAGIVIRSTFNGSEVAVKFNKKDGWISKYYKRSLAEANKMELEALKKMSDTGYTPKFLGEIETSEVFGIKVHSPGMIMEFIPNKTTVLEAWQHTKSEKLAECAVDFLLNLAFVEIEKDVYNYDLHITNILVDKEDKYETCPEFKAIDFGAVSLKSSDMAAAFLPLEMLIANQRSLGVTPSAQPTAKAFKFMKEKVENMDKEKIKNYLKSNLMPFRHEHNDLSSSIWQIVFISILKQQA